MSSNCPARAGSCARSSSRPRQRARGKDAPQRAQVNRQQVLIHQRCGERLRGRHADLGPGVHVDDAVADARGLAADDVDDRRHVRALVPPLLHRRQGIHRLARLGDGQHQGVGVDHGVAVAELGRILDADGQARQLLEHERAHQLRVAGRAARDADHLRQRLRLLSRQRHLFQVNLAAAQVDAPADGVGERVGLLVDLLLHEVLVRTLGRRNGVPGDDVDAGGQRPAIEP